jgi:MFS transporter, DHA2 family, multidrug resistance protein
LRQLRSDHPMIDLMLFRSRGFSGSVLMNLAAMFAIVGFAIFTTQYLQSVLGMSPLKAALWSLVPSLTVALAAPAATMLAQRVDRGWVMSGGFAFGAVGFAILTTIEQDSSLVLIMTGSAVYAAGIVAVMTQITEMAMGVAPPERAGSASAVLESGSELGGALGMALLGSIGDAIYHRAMTDTSAPGSARETLGGAQAEAARMSHEAGDALVHAARDAFCDGMRGAAAGAVVVTLVASVYCGKVLRGVPVAGGGGAEESEAKKGVGVGTEVAVGAGAGAGVGVGVESGVGVDE